jgi:hypothetical protein
MDYNVGDTIEYSPFGGGTRQVIVKTKEDDVKNGQPGFDGVLSDGSMAVWGYDHQITRIVTHKEN